MSHDASHDHDEGRRVDDEELRYRTEEAAKAEVARDLLAHIQRQQEAGSHSRLTDLLRGNPDDESDQEAEK